MVIAQCNDCTLQSPPLLFFSLPRRVNHHTSASLHPPPSTLAPTTAPPFPPPTVGSCDSTMRSQHSVITAQCSHTTRRSHPTITARARRRRIVHSSSHPLHRFLLLPCARCLASMYPAAGETPTSTNHNTKEPASQETGKSRSRKVGEHTTNPCWLPSADNGDGTMQSQHSVITAQCSHTARARL